MTSSVEIITTAIRAAKPKCMFQTYVAPGIEDGKKYLCQALTQCMSVAVRRGSSSLPRKCALLKCLYGCHIGYPDPLIPCHSFALQPYC